MKKLFLNPAMLPPNYLFRYKFNSINSRGVRPEELYNSEQSTAHVNAIAVGAAMLMGGGIEPDMGVVGRVRAPDEGLGAAAETLGHEAPTSAE